MCDLLNYMTLDIIPRTGSWLNTSIFNRVALVISDASVLSVTFRHSFSVVLQITAISLICAIFGPEFVPLYVV